MNRKRKEKKTKYDIYVSFSTGTGHKIALLFSVSAGQQSDNGIPQCACILFLFCIFSPTRVLFNKVNSALCYNSGIQKIFIHKLFQFSFLFFDFELLFLNEICDLMAKLLYLDRFESRC